MSTKPSSARLEARISSELHEQLKYAAKLQGRTMTDFVIAAVQEAAHQAIQKHEILTLSKEDQARFASALDAPPAPTAALTRALRRHRELFGDDL